MYIENTGAVLTWLGYSTPEDFVAYSVAGGINLDWTHSDPKPTEAEVQQQLLPYLRWHRKTDARTDIEIYIDGAIQPVTRSMLRDGEPVIDDATAEAVREFIADCYQAVNDFDDAVDLADLEIINTVAVDLPAYEGPQQ